MTISLPVSLEAEKRLHSELDIGERLIWSGKPLAQRALWGNLAFVLPGIVIAAFSVFMANMAIPLIQDGYWMGWWFSVCGAPIVLSGLWLLTLPYWAWRKAKKTIYAITDRRALILSPSWYGGISVRSITPEDFTTRTLTQRPDGSGTLVFTRLTTTRPSGHGGTYEVHVAFENILDVRDVDALLDRTFCAFQQG